MNKEPTNIPKIIQEVVRKDLCCGCGTCAGMCPHGVLTMEFNQYGEYNPVLHEECIQCGLCDTFCPSMPGNPNKDAIGESLYEMKDKIKHKQETGYYLDSFVGHAPDESIHWNGASGGLVTWILCELLRAKKIDHVITVSPNSDSSKFFNFVVVSTTEEVIACAKSAYYPVEISEVLRHVLSHGGRYAIVGLPCVCKAVRLVQKKNKIIRERIRYVFGLVCGQQNTSFFASYLIAASKQDFIKVSKISFREKRENKQAKKHLFGCFDKNLNLLGEVPFTGRFYKGMIHEYFKVCGCNYCDDVFAECADITFMDAWLPKYSDSCKGMSLFLIRELGLLKFINDMSVLNSIPIEEVIQSQLPALHKKQKEIFLRKGYKISKDKLETKNKVFPLLSWNRIFFILKNSWQTSSRKIVSKMTLKTFNISLFEKKLHLFSAGAFFVYYLHEFKVRYLRSKK